MYSHAELSQALERSPYQTSAQANILNHIAEVFSHRLNIFYADYLLNVGKIN
jgi:hypothetical protein